MPKHSPRSEIKRLLHSLGLRAKKSLGQHFLVDKRVLQRIITAAELSSQDTVIEVGAGLGILTRELGRKAGKVLAVEIDARLASALSHHLSSLPSVRVINADILQTDPATLLAAEDAGAKQAEGKVRYKVVANLPYYITSPVLRHFLEASLKPRLMVVMVQQEVGEAIVAPPGKLSLLAVSVQFYAQPSIVTRVAAESFYPQPKVDSVVLRLDLRDQPSVKVPDISCFFQLVRAGFTAPRKQLANSLAQGLGFSSREMAALLQQAGIDPRRRAETLSLEEWAAVGEVLSNKPV